MKHFFLLVVLVSTAYGFLPKTNEFRLIARQLNLRTGSEIKFAYDSLNRLIEVRNSSGNFTLYTYRPQQVIKVDFMKSGVTRDSDTFFTDKMGRALKVVSKDGSIQTCAYDTSGKPVLVEQYANGKLVSRNEFRWQNGNQTELLQYDENRKLSNRIIYGYIPASKNTISEKFIGRDFMNKHSVNLSDESLAFPSGSKDTVSVFYHYTYYNDGTVKTRVSRTGKGVLIDSTQFFY